MGESEEKEFIRMTSVQRAEALRAEFEEDLQTAWERGREAGKEEGFAEGELRGRKQGVIRVAVNLLRAGIAPAVTAKAAARADHPQAGAGQRHRAAIIQPRAGAIGRAHASCRKKAFHWYEAVIAANAECWKR